MKHSFLDNYSDISSVIHGLDPRVKIIGFFFLTVVCVSTPPSFYLSFGVYFVLLLGVLLLSRLPFHHVFGRSMAVIPFVLMVAVFIPFLKKDVIGGGYNLGIGGLTVSNSGLMILWNVVIKSYIGVLCMILLSSTVPFPKLLKGFEDLGLPKIFTTIASFMYRYVFIITDEAQRMKRARDSRCFGGKWIWHSKVIGHMIGTLFIRSYERGERVYVSMLSRGFDGDLKGKEGVQRLRPGDYIFLSVLIPIVTVVRLMV